MHGVGGQQRVVGCCQHAAHRFPCAVRAENAHLKGTAPPIQRQPTINEVDENLRQAGSKSSRRPSAP
eukprot:TRINITY_DN1415_c0_g1_i1.p3 TRINITY_DN1415_c0_g1~~TRINITY_DN1415_c0_g1_i1.p3  ORF type:complete len:67 (+),score=10.54 TRINITY_DN1415_c0_g1_i1:300-500(+)